MFGFGDVTGVPEAQVMDKGILGAQWPAPTIVVDEGNDFYLTLTNVGMMNRPDLFDPHTVHWHGFPEASSIFDGVPDASIAINMGSSLTYFYHVVEPGTYMWHCHVEATEHMQMGMLGNLYVRPKQNGTPYNYHGRVYTKFAYNDGDGSTGYDVEYPIQIGSFDSAFHDASEGVQPLPFAMMKDNYFMINGRGYPDTINPAPLSAPAENGGKPSQLVSSLITAQKGQRILLRISNLNVTQFNTLATLGIPMKVVGRSARLLRGPTGQDLAYETTSVTLGGGESVDVILDTAKVPPGTYILYSTNLNLLCNNNEDLGGMMTEIRVQP
jgi:FtsP/CotA-like multicopper oxidase with cupredoxin domain